MDAIFDESRTYRYLLRRTLQESLFDLDARAITFLLMNPSTADETKNDPTIRRCIRYATDWGFGTLYIGNLSPYRATHPIDMLEHGLPPQSVIDDNIHNILWAMDRSEKVVAAFGAIGAKVPGGQEVLTAVKDYDLYCLGKTKDGFPRHPLYMKKSIRLEDLALYEHVES